MLSVEQALDRLLAAARLPTGSEEVAVEQALGRVLARPLISPVAVPPCDNSAMDGYAVRLADAASGVLLPVSQRIAAGMAAAPLAPGSAARIFTGAALPEGAEAVVMQEDTESLAGGVRILRAPERADHIRRAGEDVAVGEEVLAAGVRLSAAHLGVAASTGATRLAVFRRLRVAVFFTGDELVMPGRPLPPGRIYNSNRACLLGLLHGLGCEIDDLGQVADDAIATRDALRRAAETADVVLTTGGVSVGEEDHVKAAVEALGHLDLWKVAMKPGKPLAFGRVGDADFIGLPGNPVSAFVVFCLFARPFLLARQGVPPRPPLSFSVAAGFRRDTPGRRREFLRARLVDGRAELYANQGSGVLTSIARADGLVDVDVGVRVAPGEPVRFLPLSEVLGCM